MVCTLTTVQMALPIIFAVIFLTMGVVTLFVVEKRKKEQGLISQTYYMSMDLVTMILMMGAAQAFSIIAPMVQHLLCLNGLLQ